MLEERGSLRRLPVELLLAKLALLGERSRGGHLANPLGRHVGPRRERLKLNEEVEYETAGIHTMSGLWGATKTEHSLLVPRFDKELVEEEQGQFRTDLKTLHQLLTLA